MSPETIDAMLCAGATAEVIAAAWKAEIVAQERMLAERREKDRERQRRHRLSRDVTVTNGDSTDPPKSISNPRNPVSPDGETPLLSQSDDVSEAVGVWNETAERCGLPKVRTLAGSRLQRLRRRISENGIDGMRKAVAAVERSAFCRGEVNGFRADIGFLTRPENFAKLIEGGFDQAEVKPKSTEPVDFVAHYAAEKKRMAAGASR